MPIQKSKPVRAAVKRQNTEAGREIQVPWDDIHQWRKAEQRDWYRIGKTNAVLRDFFRFVITKRELSNIAKLSVFRPVFVSLLTYGHEYWVTTERVLFQVQAAKDGIFAKSSRCDTSLQSAQLWNL